jgi:hypothetical protein
MRGPSRTAAETKMALLRVMRAETTQAVRPFAAFRAQIGALLRLDDLAFHGVEPGALTPIHIRIPEGKAPD